MTLPGLLAANQMNRAIAHELQRLRRRTRTLAASAATLPILGAFATCIEFLRAYRDSFTVLICFADADQLYLAYVCEALIPLALGLPAGLAAWLLYRQQQSSIAEFELEMRLVTEDILCWIRNFQAPPVSTLR